MTYPNSIPARFLSRPNRFVAQVELDGVETTVHVKNTGRCRELLVPGARVWLVKSDNPSRKTAYDLVAVRRETGSSTWIPRPPTRCLGSGPRRGVSSPA